MAERNRFSFRLKFSEFFLILLILISGTMLSFSSGGFVLNFKRIGFSVLSSMEKGSSYVVNGVKSGFTAVKELRQLKKEYNELVVKLENYEQMQRSNADIRKENERLKEQLGFSISLVETLFNIFKKVVYLSTSSSLSAGRIYL
jgi:rod shape-determining protein MreC